MQLWCTWWRWCAPLRAACARQRTFLWLVVVLVGFSVRDDCWGVTSFVRALGLDPLYYDRLLDFFHSPALDLDRLTRVWTALVLRLHPGLVTCHGRLVLVGDGLKVAKAGKKMPGVKRLYQPAAGNTKPPFILGHSCQVVSILAQGLRSVVALPLAGRIHEGVVASNRDQRTLLDKMITLLDTLGLNAPYYFVADAYYASRTIVQPLLRAGQHVVTRVRQNAVGYRPAPPVVKPKRGRPRQYGEKVYLRTLFAQHTSPQVVASPVYGERAVTLRLWTAELLWRPIGQVVRFVAVLHPTRGRVLLMTTDLTLAPLDVVRLYGYRFKIEVSFKSALHVVGAFGYHFWLMVMTPLTRTAGNQYLHRKPANYRRAVYRKLAAYQRFIQLGLIAQGIQLALATTVPRLVWASFGSWLRTIRPGVVPSEATVTCALRNTLPAFLADCSPAPIVAKFMQQRLDLATANAQRLRA